MRWLKRFVALAVVAVLGAGLWLWQGYRQLAEAELVSASGEVLLVERGTPFAGVVQELDRRGWIERPLLLRLYARIHGLAPQIHAGEYAVEPGMSALELLQRMVDGEVVQHSLTVVEGWTFREMLAAIRRHPTIEQTLAGKDPAAIMAALGHPGEHPEGRFYPDTYLFPRGTTDLQVLQRAYRTMERRLAEEWAQRGEDLPLETPYEALILASIIERESAVAAERPQIAGVFVRRLRQGMRLQTDPTVIYGLGEDFKGDIRYRHLRRDTPYNTYTRSGLPPTPIALPSGEAIHAALHPGEGDSLYFVARGDGTHVFSATLEEHNRAVRKFQLGGESR